MENANFSQPDHIEICATAFSRHTSHRTRDMKLMHARGYVLYWIKQASKALVTPESVRLDLLDSRLTDRQR